VSSPAFSICHIDGFVHRRQSCHPRDMPRFEAFPAVHYAGDIDVTDRTSPPYDVFGEDERDRYARLAAENIVHVDYPVESDGPGRYEAAARVLASWIESGVLVRDRTPSLTLYRMEFRDEAGRERRVTGVIGGLEVVDEGASGVLPHERTTPKAKTDRLDLTRATAHNLSPVWGLSLTPGLSALLAEPGEVFGLAEADGVRHVVEQVADPVRVARSSRTVITAMRRRATTRRAVASVPRSVSSSSPTDTPPRSTPPTGSPLHQIHRRFLRSSPLRRSLCITPPPRASN